MTANTDIKVFFHTNSNAPILQNAYGSMISLLDACLIDGIPVGSISALTVEDLTVTATFSTTHNLQQYQVIKISGADQVEFNGEFKVLTVPTSTAVTFELDAETESTAATGTMSAILSPLGWEKPFSSINATAGGKAAYRSANALFPIRPFLRVVDEPDPVWGANYAKYAKVAMVELMTDIDTMVGVQAPYDSAVPDKNWIGTGSGSSAYNGWLKWYYARSNHAATFNVNDSSNTLVGNRSWVLVGTSDYFYLFPGTSPTDTSALSYGFGFFESFYPSDPSSFFLSGTLNYVTANSPQNIGSQTGIDGQGNSKFTYVLKPLSQVSQPSTARTYSLGLTAYSGSQNSIGSVALSGGITPFTPVYLNDDVLRGRLPDVYWLYQDKPYLNRQYVRFGDEVFMAVMTTPYQQTVGQILIKVADV